MNRKTRAGVIVAGIAGAAFGATVGWHTGNPNLVVIGSFAFGIVAGLPFLPVKD